MMMQKYATIRASFVLDVLLFAISAIQVVNADASSQKFCVTNASGGQFEVM